MDSGIKAEFEAQELAARPPPTPKPPRDVDFVNKVRRALHALGGYATGEDVVNWLLKNEGVEQEYKVLKYRINAVLSSKSYTHLFDKDATMSAQRKASVWKLREKVEPGHKLDDISKGTERNFNEIQLEIHYFAVFKRVNINKRTFNDM